MITEAEGYALKRVNEARGDADRFTAILGAYQSAKSVTRRRLYLETMSQVLPTVEEIYIIDGKAWRTTTNFAIGTKREIAIMDKLLVAFAIILLFIIPTVTSTFYVVKEGEQVIITEFGRAVDQKTQAGLHFKKPFIQNVVSFSKRILEWNGLPNQITTKDKRFIWVDTTARWQIVDALAFYRSQRNEDIAQSRLDDIIDSATRDLITGQLLIEVVRNSIGY